MNRQARTTPPIPERIAALLSVVRILLGYGCHLADTIHHRAAAPGFAAIAACFGTVNLSLILPRVHRGILRAIALERVLGARAARGRDIQLARPRNRSPAGQPAPGTATANQQAAVGKQRRRSAADFHIPTLKELELQVRRRPIGRTIADICLDLAVVPGFCTGDFWNQLFDAVHQHGGSIATMMRERYRREQAFQRQQDRSPTLAQDRLDQRREAQRQVLGFFIGEQPAMPFRPSAAITPTAAAATGPP